MGAEAGGPDVSTATQAATAQSDFFMLLCISTNKAQDISQQQEHLELSL